MENGDDSAPLESGWMDLRRKIWDQLEEKKQLLSRRPPYKLVPNFKGSDVASNRLMDMANMRSAKVVMCDPDRVLADVRLRILEEGKVLVIPSPRLKSGILRRIMPVKGASSTELKDCARATANKCGVTIPYDQPYHVDVVVLSSVAANPSGLRIGRADLFAELEFALLSSLNVIDEQTLVLTIVHDLQVINSMDETHFGPHDVGVDYIVTPTQVIECRIRERPTNVSWSALTPECLEVLPLLKVFRQDDRKNGRNICFRGEINIPLETATDSADGSTENLNKNRQSKGRNRRKKRNTQSRSEEGMTCRQDNDISKNLNNQGKSASENDAVGRPNKKPSQNRRRNGRKSTLCSSCSEDQVKEMPASDNEVYAASETRRTRFRRDQSTLPALYIGGLVRNLRTWELRRLVKDHEVRPLFIVRPPFVGYAFLHFKTIEEVRSAINALSNLRLNDEGIRVEIARRSVSRYHFKGEYSERLSEESGSC